MKRKLILALSVLSMTSLIGCSTATQSSSLTDSDVEKIVEKAIDENNVELKNTILKEVNDSIETEISSLKSLTTKEQEKLKSSIMESVNQTIASVGKTTEIVKQPVSNNYYTTEEHITNVTEEHPTTVIKPDEPPKIVDNTPIPLETSLPYTIKVNEYLEYTITELTVTASNRTYDPYVGTDHPYKLDYTLTATVKIYPVDESVQPGIPFLRIPVILKPFDTTVLFIVGDACDNEILHSSDSIPVNSIPKSIAISAE